MKTADAQNAEPNDTAVLVHALHESVMRSLAHVSGRVAEPNLQEISLRIEPDFHFFGHINSPLAGDLKVNFSRLRNALGGVKNFQRN